ncbi:MAG: hypothetical protein HUU38_06910 [Anaerolineales bacterium]|nr:hypothetical protein [Anaerolineales bacterium]
MTQKIEIGRLLRANTSQFVVGCRVSQADAPSFGALVRVDLGGGYQVYGLIWDIRIDDDGIVRQLVTANNVDEDTIRDNRTFRNVPLEMGVLAVGYRENGDASRGIVRHLLPPRPPLSLDVIYLCNADELREFTSAGRFGYFRHLLRNADVPVGELLAAHLKQAHEAHCAAGNLKWSEQATKELIVLLRDDYSTLMAVLSAVGDALEI